MNNLKEFSDDEIVEMLKNKKISAEDLTDSGICPTCYNREHNGVVFGKDKAKTIYTDDILTCFYVNNPREKGHLAICTMKHFKDMEEADEETVAKVFVFAKQMMEVLKDVYHMESNYVCTMCDGPMNHFHVQIIPRYSYEKRGSKNFVKPRMEYVEDKEKLESLRKKILIRRGSHE